MEFRTTKVKDIKVSSLTYSSLLQIGDAKQIDSKLDALAVQKEGGADSDKGFELERYPIFDTTINPFPDPETVEGIHCHHRKDISIPTIDVTAISSSSIVQLGSTDSIQSLARQKHIRIIQSENKERL
ncbi:spore germination protein GerPE [Gracilibacillus kekensis]|uniref:Spore germination protein PE n=1 Tax=Gracilibacillus kekensis TaxID=1027249 RepID=A0A1M7IT79_9BACI|nr:spore germination protein GerPE [Gracilibacillus kekensis]SHM43808.1 spore germination protein PE [Gracilibacillus kekensis]